MASVQTAAPLADPGLAKDDLFLPRPVQNAVVQAAPLFPVEGEENARLAYKTALPSTSARPPSARPIYSPRLPSFELQNGIMSCLYARPPPCV